MRSLDESRSRWAEMHRGGGDVATLQKAVEFDGPSSPCEAGLRSVCWKTFLLFRDDEAAAHRSQTLREARNGYEALRASYMRFVKHPERLAELTVDPLADDPESPWDTFRRDELIRAEILQDVRRLPDDPFYHREDIQTLILDVLFVFCKENPEAGGYRQGMHELLAPLVHVLSEDAIESSNVPAAPAPEDADMIEMLDASFVEHDAYALFVKVMDKARAFYEVNTSIPAPASHETTTTSDLLSPLAPASSAGGVEESAIVELSKEIHEGTLMKVDPELAVHLKNIEILPQIFLIRWIRLLFGREFPFQQHLILWDSLFALDPKLHLVPLICVAMLLRIRWQLLEADYSVALQSLLKYPAPQPPHGPHTFVGDAIYLRDHLDAAGGSDLILKYSGHAPSRVVSPAGSSTASVASRPSTPAAAFAAGLGSLRSRTLKAARSPLSPLRSSRQGSSSAEGGGVGVGVSAGDMTSPSPSRFIQGREGMEALLQGAAKGVLERGEKLGINRAVRDAVGEIKRNMAQSYHEARQAAAANRASAGSKTEVLSSAPNGRRLSDGQALRLMSDMERRNQQLASLLDETVSTLKTVVRTAPKLADELYSDSKSDSKSDDEMAEALKLCQKQQQQWLEEVELAAAKVQFVKVHLEDSSLLLPLGDTGSRSPEEETPKSDANKDAVTAHRIAVQLTEASFSSSEGNIAPQSPLTQTAATAIESDPVTPSTKIGGDVDIVVESMDAERMDAGRMDKDDNDNASQVLGIPEKIPPLSAQSSKSQDSEPESQKPVNPTRPTHTIPTRSTLAQSSFSWMLEPGDTASGSGSQKKTDGGSSTSAHQSAVPPPKKAPRPSAASRTRHAFLFGEAVDQSPLGGGGSSDDPLADSQADDSDGRPRPAAGGDIFGLEPLRRAMP